MPTYEYECSQCGHRFEAFQSMTEQPLTECAMCKGRVKRLMGGGIGIIFKGSGFYATDYKNAPKKDTGSQCPAQGSCPGAPGKCGTSHAAGKKDS